MNQISSFKYILTLLTTCFLLFFPDGIWAQATPVPLGGLLPGAARPETVSRALTSEAPPPTQMLPPVVEPPKPKPIPYDAQMQAIKFKLNEIKLVGNRVYSEPELRKLYQKQLHTTITVAQLLQIIQSITNYYRNNGYILSRAILPPQHVKNGIVKVQVIEGYIGNIDVTGNPRNARCIVYRFGNKIRECRPLYLERMQRYLYLANEIPGTSVRAVLAASKTQKGAADLTLVTDHRPITGYAAYDNYGTRYIGPQQLTANINLNSAILPGDMTGITYIKTPKGGELTYNDFNYNFPIFCDRALFNIGATRAGTHPLFVLDPVHINGLTWNYYSMIYVPVIRTRTDILTLRGGLNYLDTWVTTFNEKLYTDHIRSLDVGGSYNFADRWYGTNFISGDLRKGLPIFGYSSNTDPATAFTSRPGGHADYLRILLTASRSQWIYGQFYLYGFFLAQKAFSALLAGEQFAFGGSLIGRGYDIAELLGDEGFAGSLELRYNYNAEKYYIQTLQPYIFYDAGIIWDFKFILGQPRKQSATSAGLGIRLFGSKYVTANLFWAQPLTRRVAAETLLGNGFRPRVFGSIVFNYA